LPPSSGPAEDISLESEPLPHVTSEGGMFRFLWGNDFSTVVPNLLSTL
ncbi:hypothetical protein BVRB_019110 isoform A, partial [Beta vulgaris subsp. vulgaris]